MSSGPMKLPKSLDLTNAFRKVLRGGMLLHISSETCLSLSLFCAMLLRLQRYSVYMYRCYLAGM